MTIRRRPRKLSTRAKRSTTLLPFVGKLTAPIFMVLDPVVGDNAKNFKRPLNKTQMQWFANRVAKHGGFKREDVCIISCAPPVDSDTWGQGRLISAHLKEWRDELLEIIRINRPSFILPFGAKACQQIVGRQVQITKVRGQPFQEKGICHNIPVLPMISPFYAQRQPENEATFVADLETAGRVYHAGFDIDASAIKYKHDYRWCSDLDFLLKMKPKRLSVDVESVGLTPFDPKTTILTVQICWAPGKVIVVPINYDRGKYRHHNFIDWGGPYNKRKIIAQLKKLLEDPSIEIIGQNFKFDWLYLFYKLGIVVANYAHDTMLIAHLLDENQKRINIDDLVRQHVTEMAGFNDALNNDPDHHGKSRMDLLPPDKMLPYSCGDADAAWRLLDSLTIKLRKDSKLLACYERVTMPAQRAFCWVELNGFSVSHKALYAFEKKLKFIQKKDRIWLLRQIPKSIKDKYRDTGVGVKVTRAVLLRDWLYTHPDGMKITPRVWTKTKLPSISSKDVLPYFVTHKRYGHTITKLIEYIKNDKLLNTYAKGFHKYIFDGLIRPSYGLTGTVTGRSMSRDPNGQNFPKRGKLAKEYRRIFEAPKGWVYIACDLSQAELRIAAMMSGDPNMLKVYIDGGDIHRTTAAGTMGISLKEFLDLPKDVQDKKRFQAKAVNFGFLYGMWWVKFRAYAKTDYGIDFTEKEAREIRENFFNTYPMLEVWHRDVMEYVFDKGQIRTYDGRLRHLPMVRSPDESVAKQAQRQAINSPVQSIASDLGLMTLGRLLPYIRRKGIDKWLKPCGFIHDAIVCLVREDKVAHGCDLVKRFMEDNPLQKWFDWTPEIPIIADAEIGRTLGETYEIDNEQYVGKDNRSKSFTDLLHEERDKLCVAIAKERDDGKKEKLQKALKAIETDIGKSSNIRSRPKTSYPTMPIKRGLRHAKAKTASKDQRKRTKIRPTRGLTKRSKQRRQSAEDRAA